MKILAFIILMFINMCAYSQTKKFITLKENFKDLKTWTTDAKNEKDAFTVKRKTLKLDYKKYVNENERSFSSNRIFKKLDNPVSCSFLISFNFGISFKNLRLFDTIFPIILSNTIDNPMNQIWDNFNTTQKNQNNIGIYATTFGKLDSFAIHPYEYHNGIRTNLSTNIARMRLALNKDYLIEVEMRNNDQVAIHASDPFSKVTNAVMVFGLRDNNSIHTYNTANIIFNNSSITTSIEKNTNAAFLSNLQIEDKLWIYPCEKQKDTIIIAKKSTCKINFANLIGKTLTGETSMLKEGDAFCKLDDKVEINLSADLVVTSKTNTVPYIITIVEPNTQNVLVQSSSTSFIASKPGVYTIIVSFNNDEGNCGFYTKYINVEEQIVKEKIKINANAYFDNNCNKKQDYNEIIEVNYELRIKNLQTNAVTTFTRNKEPLNIELETGDYEFQYLFQNAKQIMKPIVITQSIILQNSNENILHKLNICEKKRIAIDPKVMKKIDPEKKEIKKVEKMINNKPS